MSDMVQESIAIDSLLHADNEPDSRAQANTPNRSYTLGRLCWYREHIIK